MPECVSEPGADRAPTARPAESRPLGASTALYLGALAVWMVIILCATTYTILTNWKHSASGADLSQQRQAELRDVTNYRPEDEQGELERITASQLYVQFEAERLDVASGRLAGYLRLTTPVGGLDRLVRPPGPLKNRSLELIVSAADVPSASTCDRICFRPVYHAVIPITRLFNAETYQGRKTFTYPVLLPVSGAPEDYPQDTYHLVVSLQYRFPSGYRLPPESGADQHSDLAFSPGKVADAFDVHSSRSGLEYTPDESGGRFFRIDIGRRTSYQAYIYVLSTAPLLFCILLSHLLFSRQIESSISLLDAMALLVISTLAILPLRAVLVPSGIEGLTRVDLILGFGIVSTLCIAVTRYMYAILRMSPRAAVSDEPEGPA